MRRRGELLWRASHLVCRAGFFRWSPLARIGADLWLRTCMWMYINTRRNACLSLLLLTVIDLPSFASSQTNQGSCQDMSFKYYVLIPIVLYKKDEPESKKTLISSRKQRQHLKYIVKTMPMTYFQENYPIILDFPPVQMKMQMSPTTRRRTHWVVLLMQRLFPDERPILDSSLSI